MLRDLVRGAVEFQWIEEADHVIQRADGTFIYHLANVVDDRDFGITHVIRAEEHLSNTPRQIFIAESLGYPLPAYAHLPYVAEPGSERKLSKRKLDAYLKHADFAKVHQHGTSIAAAMKLATAPETFNPVVVDFYEQVGYLPDAIVNYLVLLGWSLDDKTEFLTRAQMIENFSLERVNPARPASTRPSCSRSRPSTCASSRSPTRWRARCRSSSAPAGSARRSATTRGRTSGASSRRWAIASRCSGTSCSRPPSSSGDEVAFDEKAFAKRVLAPGAADRLAEYRGWLADQTAFDAPTLEKGTQDLMAAKGLGLGDIVHAVRIAVTGVPVGPGLFDRSPSSARSLPPPHRPGAGQGPRRLTGRRAPADPIDPPGMR